MFPFTLKKAPVWIATFYTKILSLKSAEMSPPSWSFQLEELSNPRRPRELLFVSLRQLYLIYYSLDQGQQTTVYGPNLVCCLFLYSLQAKNSFYNF